MLLMTLVLGEETITLLKLKLEESTRQTLGGHESWMNWFRGYQTGKWFLSNKAWMVISDKIVGVLKELMGAKVME